MKFVCSCWNQAVKLAPTFRAYFLPFSRQFTSNTGNFLSLVLSFPQEFIVTGKLAWWSWRSFISGPFVLTTPTAILPWYSFRWRDVLLCAPCVYIQLVECSLAVLCVTWIAASVLSYCFFSTGKFVRWKVIYCSALARLVFERSCAAWNAMRQQVHCCFYFNQFFLQ